jgi:hypothetical protein
VRSPSVESSNSLTKVGSTPTSWDSPEASLGAAAAGGSASTASRNRRSSSSNGARPAGSGSTPALGATAVDAIRRSARRSSSRASCAAARTKPSRIGWTASSSSAASRSSTLSGTVT